MAERIMTNRDQPWPNESWPIVAAEIIRYAPDFGGILGNVQLILFLIQIPPEIFGRAAGNSIN
jgi:hypothetical protein